LLGCNWLKVQYKKEKKEKFGGNTKAIAIPVLSTQKYFAPLKKFYISKIVLVNIKRKKGICCIKRYFFNFSLFIYNYLYFNNVMEANKIRNLSV